MGDRLLIRRHGTPRLVVFPRIYVFLAIFFHFTERNYTGNPLGCWVPAAGDLQWQRPVWHLCNTVNNFAMDKKCAQLWQRLSAALKPQVSADSFKRWFSNVELIDAKEKSITLTVPNTIYQIGRASCRERVTITEVGE